MASDTAQPVPGFKSFWEKSKRIAACQNLTFVQVEIDDPNEPKKNRKASKAIRRDSTETLSQSAKSDSPPPEQRRKQVYQAQRRHRQRKTDYAKSLEDEIARLERTNANVDSEVRCFSKQNQNLRSLLQSKGVQIDEENIKLRSSSRSASDAGQSTVSADGANALDALRRQSSRKPQSKRDRLLNELLDYSDQEIDPTSKDLIERSQKLLLRDVKPFQSDEAEEKRAWERLADLVLDGG